MAGSPNELGEGADDEGQSLLSYKQMSAKMTNKNEEITNYKADIRKEIQKLESKKNNAIS